jgi:hypothetical protein
LRSPPATSRNDGRECHRSVQQAQYSPGRIHVTSSSRSPDPGTCASSIPFRLMSEQSWG